MLYFQVVILSATVMLLYYCEFTDTFSPAQQGFICRDPALTKPDPGPEQDSRVQPVILYSVLAGLPVVLPTTVSYCKPREGDCTSGRGGPEFAVCLAIVAVKISGVELVIFLLHSNSNILYDQEKVVVMGDCCYVNPMVRRTFRFLGVYVFGLFTTDIFVNAGQLVTGCLAPHFLSVCQPNYTALGCLDSPHFVSQSDACTGDPEDIMRARKTFPSKEAALSVYTAVYLAVYVTSCVGSRGGSLTAPLLSLSLVSLAVLTGINRVAEYRNHWSDVIAGQAIGGAIAVFLVVFVVQYFKKRAVVSVSPSDTASANTDDASPQRNEHVVPQSPGSFTEVT
ncbi:phospholipid phosphatase-related protein type 5-like [Perca flavescens]|uniref:phospholipid phosphatase-related protein type 5-like n=1 Tax=Perca flavescens TaxID=8167 RepID=UPI00106DFA83|nr:phospholipid phosphatase-related protein type 5-like [Perca flavescens]